MTLVRGDLAKITKVSGSDYTGLGCWNWLDLEYLNKKI